MPAGAPAMPATHKALPKRVVPARKTVQSYLPFMPSEQATASPESTETNDVEVEGEKDGGHVSARELLLALLLMAATISAFLSPSLFTGRILSPADLLFAYQPWSGSAQPPPGWGGASNALLTDSTSAYEPWRAYGARQLRAGHIPLWNPNNMLGAPFVGNTQTAIFYPPNWIYDLWPSGAVNVILAWLKLLLAAMGTYLFSRHVLRVGPPGAIVAAITYTLGSFMTVWLMFTLANTAVWLPWVWWATARLIAAPTGGKIAVMAIMAALSVFAGHAETTFHIGIVTAPYALFEALRLHGRQLRWALRSLSVLGGGVYIRRLPVCRSNPALCRVHAQ